MNLRMPLDHFPDVNLGDIEEEEEEYDMRSDNTADDVSREALASQDGLTSDDTDLEPFRELQTCFLHVFVSVFKRRIFQIRWLKVNDHTIYNVYLLTILTKEKVDCRKSISSSGLFRSLDLHRARSGFFVLFCFALFCACLFSTFSVFRL